FQAHKLAMFTAADSNKDDVLTLQEMQQARETKAKEWRVKKFEKLDANGDGKITKAEAGNMPERRFAKLDANNDGAITAAERDASTGKASNGKRVGKHFGKLDTNADGKVTKSELQAARHHFDKLDANADGIVTLDEFKAKAGKRHGDKRGKRAGRAGKKG